jgi:hypothetical protein
VASYVWSLPKLSRSAAVVRNVIGSWETTGLLTVQSGSPFSISSGMRRSFSGLSIDYADLVGNPYLDTSRPRKDYIAQYFNRAAFAPNALGTFGTAPRNLLRGISTSRSAPVCSSARSFSTRSTGRTSTTRPQT